MGRSPSDDEIALAVKFVQAEESQPAPVLAAKPTPWKYGFGEFDSAAGKLKSFTPLPHYTGSVWQGGATLPDPQTGWAMLTATGGHAGNDHAHAVVRRWTAPRDCTVSISGSLEQNSKEGDGVRARLASSREGLLASWIVHHKSADTRVTGIALKQGDTLDCIVDCGRAGDYSYDSFGWKVTIKKEAAPEAVAGDDAGAVWDSAADFTGPAPKPPIKMTAWEKYAQVLLESNEFVFVD